MEKDTCFSYDIKYLVWRTNGKLFMERFDECRVYPPTLIYQNPFYTPVKYYQKLLHEKIRVKAYYIYVNNKKNLVSQTTDHTCFSTFDFYIGNTFLHREVDLQDLERFLDGKHVNVNYVHNRNTIIVAVRQEMEQLVGLYNKKIDGK